LVFDISVDNHPVKVKAWYLAPEVFGTVPIYFLSTDLEENDFLAKTICHRLYDSETAAKIAQYILLGQGGAKLLDLLNYQPDKIHLNEAHALPAIFYDYYQHNDLAKLRDRFVFTTHTPVEAGNETHSSIFLKKMGFFHDTPFEKIKEITGIYEDDFSLTLGALRLCGKANGVSKLHGEVARKMWCKYDNIAEIDHVTNSQHAGYWTDKTLKNLMDQGDTKAFENRKKELKERLFQEVANQTGKIFDKDVLTIVWARRFAAYKRADLLTWDMAAFEDLLKDNDQPVQIIWAGKPYPMDYGAISVFNKLVNLSRGHANIAVLVRYELALSKLLKQGSDIWLNTPRVTREASGTSGMTAAMNGSINFTTFDGWIPEFAEHGKNAFVIPESNLSAPIESQDQSDLKSAYKMLNYEIKPLYYQNRQGWLEMVRKSMADVVPFFDSNRMAAEYYKKLYEE